MDPDPAQRMSSEDFLRHEWIQGQTASDEQMDDAYKRHLQRVFKRSISNHFGRKSNDDNQQLWEIFKQIDIAGNGVLDANEIRIVLRSAGEAEDVISKIVSSLNFQRHGGKVRGVTFDDFVRIMNEE
jgi:Ca2+-binding EF-hand superfamily protein